MNTLVQHLIDRQVDMSVHTVWIDETEDIATFPLWTLSGQLCGYQSYRRNFSKVQKNHPKLGKYFTWRSRVDSKCISSVAVWGLESWNFSNTLFVTEGVFDAATLTNRNVSAIALLSNDPSTSMKNWLMVVRQMRPVVAVCDPGKAGAKLAKAGHVSVVVDVDLQNDTDLNDAPAEYVNELILKYKDL